MYVRTWPHGCGPSVAPVDILYQRTELANRRPWRICCSWLSSFPLPAVKTQRTSVWRSLLGPASKVVGLPGLDRDSRPANHAPWTRPRRGIPAWSPPRALRSCAPPALAVRTGAAQLIQARPRPPRVEAAAVAALQLGRRQAAGPAFINRSADCRRIRSRGTPP